MKEYDKIIKQIRKEIQELAIEQDVLYNALKKSLPKLTERAEDFLFDYIFNHGDDYSYEDHLKKIFGEEIPFDIFEKTTLQ
jgi:hypothetical protein